ncbi:tail assembly protein [Pseudomonas sp. TKO26]|uniref:tail assembly protein n=1 Tax=unclassified Pseudomonas TaxID=196821 RepID=UPI000D84E4E0|nr:MULTISPECIES: tail assembly protein [unclassified Pseudomonas]PYY88085.1 tail assembly protein [Pseudomonas sp. TKO30]PYY91068.1 tail assembly protein [Pseudomonas sp. TKO29]PYY93942.1 tail assembly protein [Pseudomonas sp. TKO26]PYZ00671.1 tail assembly protein [Pseudomonas sp. TKO14]
MSAEKMQTILLSGSLAKLFGRRHRVVTRGGWRDVMGYFKQFPGFERHMAESSRKGLRYAIFYGKENISEADLGKPTGRDVIRIVPVVTGSKRAGMLQTIVGAVLVVVGLVYSPLLPVGIAMLAGGVIQMLSPQAKGLGTQDSPNNRASYSFNGAVNTSVQGNPVPLLYGRMIVGSAVISAGIYSEDQM